MLHLFPDVAMFIPVRDNAPVAEKTDGVMPYESQVASRCEEAGDEESCQIRREAGFASA